MTSYWLDSPNDGDVILPSIRFQNASQFFDEVKPPFYEDSDYIILDDNLYPNCYGMTGYYAFQSITTALLIVMLGVLL